MGPCNHTKPSPRRAAADQPARLPSPPHSEPQTSSQCCSSGRVTKPQETPCQHPHFNKWRPALTFREFHIMNPVFGGFGFFFKAKRFLFLVVRGIFRGKKNIKHHVTHSLPEKLKSVFRHAFIGLSSFITKPLAKNWDFFFFKWRSGKVLYSL